MANVGQIIYNLEDYNSSGGYISTANGNTTQTITSATDPEYETNKIDIFNRNLVEIYASKQFSKVGIQAPPGTKLVMNTNKNIMIGRTGVYELDEDIAITGLYFLRPKNYILDSETTEKNLSDGKKKLEAAESARKASMEELEKKYPDHNDAYWSEYNQIQAVYDEAYRIALAQYNTGINGVYKLDTDNPYKDLYNVIIDFIY
jgi:hypothetical protein